MQQYLTGDNLLKTGLFVLACAWAYNLIYTAVTNSRAEKKRRDEPLEAICADIRALRNDLSTDRQRIADLERELGEHSEELQDVKRGQTELCRGVQALLDHELHDGNNDEMQAASNSIGKWLRTR